MSQPTIPIPLICLGGHRDLALTIEKDLAPNFVYPAIMTSYNKEVLLNLLETLNPPPRGIAIGGLFPPEEVAAVERIAAEREGLQVMRVPPGTFEREGLAGVVGLVKKELGRMFGVSWGAEGS
jgi:hypothetical protein